jgi:hypothetical protein
MIVTWVPRQCPVEYPGGAKQGFLLLAGWGRVSGAWVSSTYYLGLDSVCAASLHDRREECRATHFGGVGA